jgi:hypothetical protein
LRYLIRALPASLLLGPDGTVLARDPTAKRAEELVRALR